MLVPTILIAEVKIMRALAQVISEGFIWGVGITRPKPGNENVAAWYITLTLVASLLIVGGVFLLLVGRI
jgi:hypothetical protein